MINASKEYVPGYYVNCGEQCGAWECIAESLAEVVFCRGGWESKNPWQFSTLRLSQCLRVTSDKSRSMCLVT